MTRATILRVFLVAATGFLAGRAMGNSSVPVTGSSARCTVYIPREWDD